MIRTLKRLFEEMRRKRRQQVEGVQQQIADALGIDTVLDENDRRLKHLEKQRDIVRRQLRQS